MWYSVLWGSRRALALSSMPLCVCAHKHVHARAFMHACVMEMEADEGIKMGLFMDSLQAYAAVMDLQLGVLTPPKLSAMLAWRIILYIFTFKKKIQKETEAGG